jgi:cyclophilin family peptidyl-prolyl cis-trans isomerase
MRSNVPTLPIVLAGVLVLLMIVGFFYFQNQRNRPEMALQTPGGSPSPGQLASLMVASPTTSGASSPMPSPSESALAMMVAASGTPGGSAQAQQVDLSVDANGLSKATVTMNTTQGVIKFKFYPKDAPNTVNRFIQLIQQGFYNNLNFHRVIPGFVIQGGDPLGNGTGGSGQKLKAEFNNRRHIEGTVAMARASDPDSADSQFYISLGTHPHLDRNYTVFGQVTEGMDVAKKIKVGDKMVTVKVE